jgi:general secretion pathway protein D
MKTLHTHILIVALAFSATSALSQTENAQAPPPAETSLNQRTPVTSPANSPLASDAAPDATLRLNFRGAPLELVLNYLSEAAGFIIVLETEVKGKVDVWSNHPVTKDEAIQLLDSMLRKNGYAAIRNGRTLTIVSRDTAKTRDIPVKPGNDPKLIPRTDEMITQIIPVRYANATQLTRDLQPLLPTDETTLTANESANALVLTAPQATIHRMVEIVQALDTSISSISAIRVFSLRYADAKQLATMIKELFTPQTSTQRGGGGGNNARAQFLNRLGGGAGGFGGGGGFPGAGGGRGGGGGGGGGSTGTGTSEAREAASRVVAVADEATNSLVVSAPDEYIPTIEQLIKELDASVTDVTELRVFHLQNSDPVEMASLLMELFPDESNNQAAQGQVQFRGGGGFGGGRGNNSQQSGQSERMKKKGRVIAVPDQRTASIIVSADRELITQIEAMVAQLDANPARKQKVFVYTLENADVQSVEEILRNMFEGQTTRNARGNTTRQQNNNPLNNRTVGAGGQGFGTGGGGGGGGQGGGGQNFR